VGVSEAAFLTVLLLSECSLWQSDRYLSVLAMSSVVVVELTLIDVVNGMQFDDFWVFSAHNVICISIKHPVCNVLRGY